MGTRAAPYWFISPALLLMIVVLIAPIGIALVLSFSDYSLGSDGFDWVGIENYERIATRSSYISMFMASATYVVVVVPISVAMGLGVALLLQSLKFGRDLYKTVFFLPVMATLLAMAIVWEIALHPSIGLVNQTLESLCGTGVEGFFSFGWLPFVDGSTSWYSRHCADGSFPLWLRDKDYALGTLCFIGIWQAFGFNMVLYLAGLTSIPRDLLQAAEMDGVKSSWERFRLVTWPMLGPTTVFVVTITSIRSFQVFDTVEALTKGGPSKSTYVMMYALYEKAVKQNLMGIGAAITIVFLVFVLFITLIQRYLVERRVHYS
jgi:multiple sugar transport system permease protein